MNKVEMKKIIERSDKKYRYMLLSRMEMDCGYFLGNGNRYVGHLLGENVEDHIAEMKMLWDSFKPCEKPEWLTMEEIESLEKRMKA